MLEASYGRSRLPKAMNYQSRRWPQKGKAKYAPPAPENSLVISLDDALEAGGRAALADNQLDLLRGPSSGRRVPLFVAGDTSLFSLPSVSIVGTREVSEEGAARARRLARELCQAGVAIVSGLAKGVDTAAHTSAINSGGRTIAVIGTPLSKAYPAENAALQEQIYSAHLLVSPFSEGEAVFKSNFPKRNRVMAAISDATVIIEASDTSGTLHQAAECQRLGRWLFITKVVAEDPSLEWPKRFIGKPKVGVLRETSDIIAAING
ncbi:MAG: DNA-processing protein DprA [Methylocystis silviterrae]